MEGNRLADETRAANLCAQKHFLFWAAKRGYLLRDITGKELRQYHQYLCTVKSKRSNGKLSAKTVHDRFHAVTKLFFQLYREALLERNPVQEVRIAPLPREGGNKRRPFTRREINLFLDHFDTSRAIGLRDRTLFELIYSSGLRVAEASKLLVRDIDFSRREMIVRGKGDRDRIIPFSRMACLLLKRYLGDRAGRQNEWVFPGKRKNSHLQGQSISGRFRELLDKRYPGKRELTAHCIRHATATHLLENGASIRYIQELLGHKNIQTTVRYTHLQIDGAFRIYQKYHPREHDLFDRLDRQYWEEIRKIVR
jgi:site-specific recombinase XerD